VHGGGDTQCGRCDQGPVVRKVLAQQQHALARAAENVGG
jgi:hypothetical protein